MRVDIEKQAKSWPVCLNAGKSLKPQILTTEKSKIDTPKKPGEEIRIDFTGNLKSKRLNSSPFILIAVDKNSRWPAAEICKNTDHDTIITCLRYYIIIFGYRERSNRIKAVLLSQKITQKLCNENNIDRKYGTPNLHSGTGLVERTIQSMNNLIKANLEEKPNLHESLNKALYVLRFTIYSEIKKTPFELHFGRKH